MRTTLDIPDEIFQRAKIAAIQRRTTLRALVATAVAKEIGAPVPNTAKQARQKFPLFPSRQPGKLRLTGRAIEAAEAAAELRRHDLSR
jgi:hypothetical protein